MLLCKRGVIFINHTKQSHIAIVTGVSHSKGIGAAVGRQLAKQGVDLFFTYWQAEAGWVAVYQQEIRELGVRCEGLEIDLSSPCAPKELFDHVNQTLGLPTILVNNAAVSQNDGYEILNVQILDNHYAVNIRATCLLSVEFARRLKDSHLKTGRIINLTSGQAQGAMPGELAYVATKGAISAFTQSLSVELAPIGITVNAVNPGPTDTGWMTPEIKEKLAPKFMMGRVGLPEDASRLIGFLVSDEAQWITGQVIHSEGGFFRA